MKKTWFQDAFVDQVTPDRTTLAVLSLELLESQVYQSVPLVNVDAVATEKLQEQQKRWPLQALKMLIFHLQNKESLFLRFTSLNNKINQSDFTDLSL